MFSLFGEARAADGLIGEARAADGLFGEVRAADDLFGEAWAADGLFGEAWAGDGFFGLVLLVAWMRCRFKTGGSIAGSLGGITSHESIAEMNVFWVD